MFPLLYFRGKTRKPYTVTVLLISHWLELSHIVTLAAKEGGKYRGFFQA